MSRLEREKGLLTEDGINKLAKSRVTIIGCGGVGSYAVEALARAGVGFITIIDGDVVSESNINRQLIATVSTVGQSKAMLEKKRISDINPDCVVKAFDVFLNESNCAELLKDSEYIIDACDDTKAKLEIIRFAKNENKDIVSCMGTGNRLDPTAFEIKDISKTEGCPLARSMRKKLREEGINHLAVLSSRELPLTSDNPPSSVSFVPPVAGFILAGYIIRKITGR